MFICRTPHTTVQNADKTNTTIKFDGNLEETMGLVRIND